MCDHLLSMGRCYTQTAIALKRRHLPLNYVDSMIQVLLLIAENIRKNAGVVTSIPA